MGLGDDPLILFAASLIQTQLLAYERDKGVLKGTKGPLGVVSQPNRVGDYRFVLHFFTIQTIPHKRCDN